MNIVFVNSFLNLDGNINFRGGNEHTTNYLLLLSLELSEFKILHFILNFILTSHSCLS